MTYVPPTLEHSGSTGIAVLKDRHKGETAWIVGKGPSLAHLRASDIGPGPVITINQAIEVIQNFGLPQHVYAMQKDGCDERDENNCRPCGSCAVRGWKRDPIIDPYPGIATVFSQHLSSWCLHGRPNRYVFTDRELGYDDPLTMSVLEAIAFAKHLGAARIVMACFDSLTVGDLATAGDETRTPEAIAILRTNLQATVPRVLDALADIEHRFLTP